VYSLETFYSISTVPYMRNQQPGNAASRWETCWTSGCPWKGTHTYNPRTFSLDKKLQLLEFCMGQWI